MLHRKLYIFEQNINEKKHYIPIILLVIFSSVLIPEVAMAFKPFQICMFSEVNAVVTLKGEPVAGAEIIRTSNELDSKVYTEKTITDKYGKFHFDALWVFSFGKLIPSEPMIKQTMIIRYQGKEYLAWEARKRNYGQNDELDDNMQLAFTCELGDEPTIKYQKLRGNINGICKW